MNKEELKDGDMLWMRDNWIFIYDSLAPTPVLGHNDVIIYKAVMHKRDGDMTPYISIPIEPCRGIGYFSEARNVRYATNYEKEDFYEELRIRGYRYNEETKRVEKIQ